MKQPYDPLFNQDKSRQGPKISSSYGMQGASSAIDVSRLRVRELEEQSVPRKKDLWSVSAPSANDGAEGMKLRHPSDRYSKASSGETRHRAMKRRCTRWS